MKKEARDTRRDRIGLLDFGRAALSLLPGAGRSLWATLKVYALTRDSRQSIGSVLEQQAERLPDKDCLLFEGQRWTYRDFNAWVNRIAQVLQQHGVGSGDTVGLLIENRPELLACVAAVVKLGAVAGLLNPTQRGAVLRHSLVAIQPRLMVIGGGCVQALHSAVPERPADVPWLWAGPGPLPADCIDLPQACQQASTANPPGTGAIRAGSPCCFIFTSGTTGLPKASVMTHQRWLRSGYGMGQAAMRLTPDDVFYCPLPFHHNNALTVCWSAVLTTGATLAMARKFSASGFWADVRATHATAFVYIGEPCRYLLNQPPCAQDRKHSVRVMIGIGLRTEIWDTFQQRFGSGTSVSSMATARAIRSLSTPLGCRERPRSRPCPMPTSRSTPTWSARCSTPKADAAGRRRRDRPADHRGQRRPSL